MKNGHFYITVALLNLSFYTHPTFNVTFEKSLPHYAVTKIEMNLSAMGVESDGFPYIQATIDFKRNSSICKVSYDNPKFKDSTYSLTVTEMKEILNILQKTDLAHIKKEYKTGPTDQPTSTTIIYTAKKEFRIEDYALQAKYPLSKLYKIVYKLKSNFR